MHHQEPEQQVEEALSELERPAMAGIDPNALHPAKHSNVTLFLRRRCPPPEICLTMNSALRDCLLFENENENEFLIF